MVTILFQLSQYQRILSWLSIFIGKSNLRFIEYAEENLKNAYCMSVEPF